MTTEALHKKTERYLCGVSKPAETRQIQNWLSCTSDKENVASADDRTIIENKILAEVQAYTAYPLFFAKPEPWWKKIISFF